MFDTRNNLLSVMLLAGIGVLVLFGALAFWLFGAPDVESIEPATSPASVIDRPLASNPELDELTEYAAIVERPVFFADRELPVMEVAGDAEEAAAEPEPVAETTEIPDLGAKVAGIIITPELKLAMVTDQSTNETLVLREGMALAGDKSAWKVASIRPRAVQFATDGGRTEDLELEVETSALKTGARPPARQQTAAADPDAQADGEQQPATPEDAQAAARARAEEIRRRVAERRAQLRAEAERRAQQNDDG